MRSQDKARQNQKARVNHRRHRRRHPWSFAYSPKRIVAMSPREFKGPLVRGNIIDAARRALESGVTR